MLKDLDGPQTMGVSGDERHKEVLLVLAGSPLLGDC